MASRAEIARSIRRDEKRADKEEAHKRNAVCGLIRILEELGHHSLGIHDEIVWIEAGAKHSI